MSRPADGAKAYEPADPGYEDRVRENFARQRLMETIGARLVHVLPGEVTIELPCRDDLTQQHGYVHAGVVTSIVDSACGYAAYSLMPADSEVLSVEFKVNLLAPAAGERLLARSRIVRAGRTLTVCQGDVFSVGPDVQRHIATMVATMMRVARERGSDGAHSGLQPGE